MNPNPKIEQLRGAWGKIDLETSEVSLHKDLKRFAIPSKNIVLHHELYHKWLYKNEISLSEKEEELKCDIYALFKCRDAELSDLEFLFKKILKKKFNKNPSKKDILNLDINKLKLEDN